MFRADTDPYKCNDLDGSGSANSDILKIPNMRVTDPDRFEPDPTREKRIRLGRNGSDPGEPQIHEYEQIRFTLNFCNSR